MEKERNAMRDALKIPQSLSLWCQCIIPESSHVEYLSLLSTPCDWSSQAPGKCLGRRTPEERSPPVAWSRKTGKSLEPKKLPFNSTLLTQLSVQSFMSVLLRIKRWHVLRLALEASCEPNTALHRNCLSLSLSGFLPIASHIAWIGWWQFRCPCA